MNLSLRHMKAFTALANLRNFTRAAEHCCLTQSAFSALISNLESDLGLKLFSRNTRNVDLTAEGAAFQQVVAHLLPEIERGLAEMRDYVERRKGRVALAAIPSISSGILPGLLARFTRDFPGISVEVQDVASTVCVDMVRNRQVDFALCAAVSPSTELAIEVLARDTFYLICPHTHPLATRARLDVQDILVYPVIGFERNSSIRQHLDAAIYPRQWLRSYEVNSLSTAAGLVAAGLGVTIAPTLALFQFRLAGLHAIPVSLPINERDICLARRTDTTDSLAAQALLALLRTHFKDAVEAMAPAGAAAR
ncbi:LysR family transcriptional regulator [Schauerella aestuarii]|uniref:LysR family transcriptional regulator n=1 Tax=Schauerella aestuarii TaxID=2511204 RepID=UPI00136DC8D9|nr:LysR family transcriptional regulator [Achromobacter aestuarii]MYZ44948.1 LysR family transcriptional regulator [Achromobacter aestuarii]